jgi:L-iditol 2-dehydrogenase
MLQAYMPKAQEILYRDIEIRKPNDNEVMIKVSKIGICGSDIHVFDGKHPLVNFPLVQGHEFCGYVVKKGEKTTKANIGDLVVIQPAVGCKKCKKCQSGMMAQCDNLAFIGGALSGGGSEYFVAEEEQVIKLNADVKPQDAAMIEPLAVAVHNVNRVPTIEGQDVLIMGAGTIGNLTAQVAKLNGARKVSVFDINQNRLDIAKKCGINAYHASEVAHIYEKSKAQVSFECVGKEKPLNDCIDHTERGGYVVVPGVYSGNPSVEMIKVQDCELNVLGSLMYTWEDYYKSVDLVEKSWVKLSQLQTHILPFSQWLYGYQLLKDQTSGALKIIIDLD